MKTIVNGLHHHGSDPKVWPGIVAVLAKFFRKLGITRITAPAGQPLMTWKARSGSAKETRE
jgi:hypothetical protein